VKGVDPATMAPAERLAELAELLAAGAQRYFAQERKVPTTTRNSQVRLAVPTAVEAPCGSHALNPKSTSEPAA